MEKVIPLLKKCTNASNASNADYVNFPEILKRPRLAGSNAIFEPDQTRKLRMNKYDKLFLEQARMGYSNFVQRYKRKSHDHDLKERKYLLNKAFVFSEENIKRLNGINTILSEKGKAAYQQAEKLENDILITMQHPDSFISDYEIKFKIDLFAEKKYAHISDLHGNPFFECEPIWFYKSKTGKESEKQEHKDWLLQTDHRVTFNKRQPLNGFPHCYLFHELIYNTILSCRNIIGIEDIWLEVVLTLQNRIPF